MNLIILNATFIFNTLFSFPAIYQGWPEGGCVSRICKADWHCTGGKVVVDSSMVTSDVCKIVYISRFPEGSFFGGPVILLRPDSCHK